ncbi:hypothetical protein PINS_up014429 [Pythium insidiosum]|nr:hypothetical protein PINS_up014429 [Pythium insidiosum]
MADTLESLRARAAEIRANTVSRKSRQAYEATWTRFLSWLIDMKPERMPQVFKDAVAGQECSSLRKSVRSCLDADVDRVCPPILFNALQADDFIQWLLSIRKGDGGECGYSTYNCHRAALFNLYREYKFVMSETLQSELSTHFRGLKRTVAERTTGGVLRVKVGKDPLSFELYSAICDATLAMDAKEAVFVRTFLFIT